MMIPLRKITWWVMAVMVLFLVASSRNVTAQAAWLKPVALQADLQQGPLHCMYQDRSGLIWIGSGAGLFTFDGMAFHSIRIPGRVGGTGPTALFEASDGMMWIGMEDGSVLKYDRMGTFEPVAGPDTASRSKVTGFLEDLAGHTWIATYGSGALVRNDTGIVVLNADNGLSDNYIYSMILDRKGRIWMGTDNGINICETSNGQEKISTLSISDGLPDFIVQSLKMDSNGDIWIGMYDRGICKYEQGKRQFTVPSALTDWQSGSVRDLVLMEDRIWAATSGKGILEYTFDNDAVSYYESYRDQSLARVGALMSDLEGNVWMMSNNELFMSLGNKVEFHYSPGGMDLKNIHALTVDDQDRVWFADDRGLFSYEPYSSEDSEKPVQHSLKIDLADQKIMSIYRDHFGYVWVGTFGRGLIRLDPATGRQQIMTEKDGLVNGNVLSIAGNEKEIWFGTLGGASRCLLDDRLKNIDHVPSFQNFGLEEGLVNNYIYQVYLAGDGTPYFATDGSGVLVYRAGSFESIAPGSGFANEVVYSVAIDESGGIWMNVADKGLFKVDGNEATRISDEDRHGSMTYSGILGSRHDLVIACDEGIDVLDTRTGSIRHFEENAGIVSIDPDLNTLARDSRNNIWIGTARGIIRIRPLRNGLWEHPVVRLTGVALFLDPLDFMARNTFDHNDNHLTFNYSGLWYQYPERVEYLVRLEGHDLDWIRTRNDQVIYSDLNPGTYTFRVKTGMYGNFSQSNEAIYSFRIREPFYYSIWFYIVVVLIAGALVAVIFTLRVRQVQRKQEIIQEKIRFQFENLKSQINPHFLFNSFSTLIALIEDDARAAVNYVEDLSTLFRNILEYKDQELVSLDREFRISGSYINLQKKRFGDSLQVTMESAANFGDTKIPPLTLQLLIENAIKHNVVSREKPLVIRVYSKPGENRIFVENNIQAKMENAPSTGVGINNIVSRYRLLTDREVQITRSDTAFTVGLPYINK